MQDDVGAQRQRLLQIRRRKRVVDDELGVPASWATAAIASMSPMLSSGLVGVSTRTPTVCGVIAARTASTRR